MFDIHWKPHLLPVIRISLGEKRVDKRKNQEGKKNIGVWGAGPSIIDPDN